MQRLFLVLILFSGAAYSVEHIHAEMVRFRGMRGLSLPGLWPGMVKKFMPERIQWGARRTISAGKKVI